MDKFGVEKIKARTCIAISVIAVPIQVIISRNFGFYWLFISFCVYIIIYAYWIKNANGLIQNWSAPNTKNAPQESPPEDKSVP
jgi:hypothetical protein